MDFQNDTSTLANLAAIAISGDTLTFNGTGALNLPSGNTTQRPTANAAAGAFRYNTSVSSLEFYNGSTWVASSSTNLNGLSDTTITSPTNGQILTYDGTSWINSTQLTSSNLVVRHILLGDSVTNANVGNVYIEGSSSGITADRPLTFIDTAAVQKIVRIGNSPGLELQEWDNTISNNIGYWDMVSYGGDFQIRDRKGNQSSIARLWIQQANGNMVVTSLTSNGAISGSNLSGTNTGDQTITLTGDITGSGTDSFVTSLSNTGITSGTYTTVTVDAKGRVSAGSTTQLWDTISGTPTTLAGYGITNALSNTTVFSGDVTGTFNAMTLANTGVTAGTYNKVTVNSKGLVTGSTALTSTDITTALTYTPLNGAGSVSIGGALSVGGVASFNGNVSTQAVTGLVDTGLTPTSAVPLSYAQANFVDFAVGGGQVLRSISSVVPASGAQTATYTLSNNVPASTTGIQVWTNSIAPITTTSKVRVTGTFSVAAGNAGRTLIAFVFRGTTCIGVAGTICSTANTGVSQISIDVVDSPATTATTTYSVRVASTAATTWYVNQLNTAYFAGLLAKSTLNLLELS